MSGFQVIRARRKTVAIQVSPQGEVIVRAPYGVSREELETIVASHRRWIEKRQAALASHPEPTEAERQALIRQARAILPTKVDYYARLMGVRPTGITVTGARTRFGSCSPKNALSFSWRLMRYPEAAIDYVVVHELAHIRHHDHSPAFYDFVASVLPDHRERRALLRE